MSILATDTGAGAVAMAADPQRARRLAVLAAATLGMAAGFGGIATIGTLMPPLQAEFGWAKADISLSYVLLTTGAAGGGLVAGRLADRLPAGPIAAAGVAVLGLGLVMLSLQSSLRAMQATYLVMGLLGFSCLYAPLLTTVSAWFRAGHGLAIGIVTAGGALGQAAVTPLLEFLTAQHGWRDAAALLGFLYLLAVAPAMLAASRPREAATAGGEACGRSATWPIHPALGVGLVCLAGLLCCMLMGVPTVHLVSLAREKGFSAADAARIASMAMLAAFAARILTGLLVDRAGALAAYALVSSVQTAAMLGFMAADDALMLEFAAVVYGLGFGGAMTALVCCVREASPPQRLGSAMSIVGLLAWAGMAAGGYQGGLCFDLTGRYDLSFALAALAGLGNLATLGLIALLLRRAPQSS